MIDLILKTMLACGIMLPLFIRFPRYFRLGMLDLRKWKRPSRGTLKRIAWVSAFGLVIGLTLFPRLDELSVSLGPVIDESHPQVQIYMISPALLLLVVALMPILEEWLFRGCLMKLFKDKKGPIIALLASAALFGLFHTIQPGAYPLAFISPFVAGLVFGWAYLAQGLASSVVCHSSYNIAIFLIWWL